jgi:hypothetical protein
VERDGEVGGQLEVPVSAVPSAAEQSPAVGRARAGGAAQWLILGCYLLGAVALTWRLWADPAARSTVGDPGPADVDLFAWFLRYEATAIAHGHLPALVTTAMNAPRGINLMWNTSILLPGTLVSPVTLLAGPQVGLTVLLTLGFAGSAATLFFVLRRWGASLGAAALGGAVYGFSPALLDSGIAHYMLVLAILPPLIIDALLRIVTVRGSPVRNGVWLGLLAAAQLLTGEELLVNTAMAGLVLVVALAASRPRAIADRVRGAALGIGTAAAVGIVVCGYPLWVQFHGPLAEHGSPWPTASFITPPGTFVTPPGTLLFHTSASAAAAAVDPPGLWEYLGYLGWPLLVVLVAAALWFWRDLRVRTAAICWAFLELCTLGGHTIRLGGLRYPGSLLPWHWLEGLPVFSQMLPSRLAIVADGAAAAVLALSLDLARWPARRPAAGPTGDGPVAGPALDWRRRTVPAAIAVLAVLPLIPLPVQTAALPPVPAGWQATFTRLRLPADARVLVVPVPYSQRAQTLRWQADTGQPRSVVGGWFIGPDSSGHAVVEYFGRPRINTFALYLDALWSGSRPGSGPPQPQIRADLAYLRPAAVVAVTSRGSALGRFLTGLFGQPSFQIGQMLAWRR